MGTAGDQAHKEPAAKGRVFANSEVSI